MNPTTLQKVLELLGAKELNGKAHLKRVRADAVIPGSIWKYEPHHEALIIAEIEEALKEEGFWEFRLQGLFVNVDNPEKVGFLVEAHCRGKGTYLGRAGSNETKLDAWCDLFLKYRGVE